MNPLLILVLIVWAVSGVGLIVFVLLHSGKGTGVSDMIASSLYSTQTGTNIIEKNLDRITIIFAIVSHAVAARAHASVSAGHDFSLGFEISSNWVLLNSESSV